MLSKEQIDAYLEPMTAEQSASIRSIRDMIAELNLHLHEEIDKGKWFGGQLTYYTEDRIHAYALGPLTGGFTTFHMMPFYGSKTLQERHGPALKKLLSGKSCIKFKTYSQIPEDALRDILAATPKYAELAREMFAARKKKSP